MNIDIKIFNKILANSSVYYELYTKTKWDLLQQRKVDSSQKSLNILHHINRLKKKIKQSLSLEGEKALLQKLIPIHDLKNQNEGKILQFYKEHPQRIDSWHYN